jgi:hypothetical protein
MWLTYSSNKQFTQFIRFCLFILSAWSLLITITYDMSFPNWVLIFASRGNAMIELFVFMLGFRQESSKLINLMYFKQTGVDLLVFLIMGVAVQSIFYRMGMAHRVIWFCCSIERFGRVTELFSFEEIVEAVFWGILADVICFSFWFGFSFLLFVAFIILPAHFLIYNIGYIPDDKDAERELFAWWCLGGFYLLRSFHSLYMLNLNAVKRGASRQRTDLDRHCDSWNRVPNSDDETRMVRMAGGDYGALKKTN